MASMMEVSTPSQWVVTGKNGCLLREGCELDSREVGDLAHGTEVTVATIQTSSCGKQRAQLSQPRVGWASLKMLSPRVVAPSVPAAPVELAEPASASAEPIDHMAIGRPTGPPPALPPLPEPPLPPMRASKLPWVLQGPKHAERVPPTDPQGVRLRLFCVHQAAVGAWGFHGWSLALPEAVELMPVELPGRNSRMAESKPADLCALVEELADALAPLQRERPCVCAPASKNERESSEF